MKRIFRFLKIWVPVAVCGAALGLGVAWAEEHFKWSKGSGGRILLGIMAMAAVAAFWAFYLMLCAEVEEDY